MRIGIPTETADGETRVAAVPQTVKALCAGGAEVVVQRGAGQRAMISDQAYQDAGATLVDDAGQLLGEADVVLKVNPPTAEEVARLKRGATLISILAPARNEELLGQLAQAGVIAFALDIVPRIARAQSMDVLSSMASLAGYKAVLLAADALPKLMPMMMTAAGTIHPASALVIGAGVAGLQAIATARRLGANVKAVDVRPAAREQVESLGAKFVPMEVHHDQAETAGGYAKDLGEEFYRQEQEIIAPHLKGSDLVVTTALIPGRQAPILITEAMVETMATGSAIVDLAGEAGGNCTMGKLDERVEYNGVTILTPRNLPAMMPAHASLMFARNVAAFLNELLADGQIRIDTENEIIRATLVTRDGQIVEPDKGDKPGEAAKEPADEADGGKETS